LRSRADGFIADIDSVHFNASGPAESAAERDRRKTVFGRVEGSSILNLHSRLQLGEIEKVAAIDRQILNLLAGKDALHRGLFRIDRHFVGLYFHYLCALTQCEPGICCCGCVHLNGQRNDHRLESAGFNANFVTPGDQCSGSVSAGRIAYGCTCLIGALIADSHLRATDHCAGRIGNCSLNAAG
jgi:hypothetical protein